MEDFIAQLVRQFHTTPGQFFHERELHAVFFGLCVDQSPTAQTQDGHEVRLFRNEFDTLWRYARRDPSPPYTERLRDRGTTACLDFVVLSKSFVAQHPLLTVINKDEGRRDHLRESAWTKHETSAMVDIGIEFKMAHRRHQMHIAEGQINALERGMRLDARKLAMERIGKCYVIGFSHGPLPNDRRAAGILRAVVGEHAVLVRDAQGVEFNALLATPSTTFLAGGWANFEGFPKPFRVQ